MIIGGVTQRFPTLKFAFLEGGVGWACRLYADLIGHWVKRNGKTMENYNPSKLDRTLFADLFHRYGGKDVGARLGEASGGFWPGCRRIRRCSMMLALWH